jgi:hypothetical protein
MPLRQASQRAAEGGEIGGRVLRMGGAGAEGVRAKSQEILGTSVPAGRGGGGAQYGRPPAGRGDALWIFWRPGRGGRRTGASGPHGR